MTFIAHAGHWYVQLIFASPVFVLGAAMAVDAVRSRRKKRRSERGEE